MPALPSPRCVAALALLAASGAAHADVTPPPPAQAGEVVPRELTLAEAMRGVGGAGRLTATISVEGTVRGEITCTLRAGDAPRTVANFVGLARGLRAWKDEASGRWVKRPFYDGLTFHRVIPEFMIQGGDPRGDCSGEPGYTFPDENLEGSQFHAPGVLAMANRGPNTNGAQFFITEKEAPWLDGRHVAFGDCGPIELVKRIARVPRAPSDRPLDPVRIARVRIWRAPAGP
jgi:peptidyl-prolyl cis-trans isomerase A (cyclophilin A)